MSIPRISSRRQFLSAAGGVSLMAAMLNLAPAAAQEKPFEPMLGRLGKDVIWLPTPDELVHRMMVMAKVGPDDVLVDLGSGDGKIVIAAAKDFGAKAWGVEFDQRMVDLSRQRAEEAGVRDLTRFEQGDIFTADFSKATVVAMYLLPEINVRLRPKLMAMKPGTRIVTYQFHLGRWEPDEVSTVSLRPGHLWIVPANAGGNWTFAFNEGGSPVTAELELSQTFQKVEGSVKLATLSTSVRTPQLLGRELTFAFKDMHGNVRTVNARVEDNTLHGTISGPDGSAPFVAQRQGSAPPIAGSEPPTQEELNAAAASLESI